MPGLLDIRTGTQGVRIARQNLERYRRLVLEDHWNCIKATGRKVRKDARLLAPKASGVYAKSIKFRGRKRDLKGKVGSDEKYGPTMELGAGRFYIGEKKQRANADFSERPPPIAGLKPWADQKGFNVFLLQKALVRQGGVRPKPHLQPALAMHTASHFRCVERAYLVVAPRRAAR